MMSPQANVAPQFPLHFCTPFLTANCPVRVRPLTFRVREVGLSCKSAKPSLIMQPELAGNLVEMPLPLQNNGSLEAAQKSFLAKLVGGRA